jgi:hypothetical protein
MSGPRFGHTATLLPNGKVLIAGGETGDGTGPVASAELYDPVTGKFSPTGSMTAKRERHTATLLGNGKVLIAGGDTILDTSSAPWTFYASAELYDPASGTFSATGSMATGRTAHTATLLKDGRVLIASGCGDKNVPVASAELYDPAAGEFSPTGSVATARCYATGTLLPSGKVLVAGGDDYWYGTSAELYDPVTGTFGATGSMVFGRLGHGAIQLPSGKVLLFSGNGQMNQAVEIYDSSAGKFSRAPFLPPPSDARTGVGGILLPSGEVLFAGGGSVPDDPGVVASAELFDPATNSYRPTASMSAGRAGPSLTLLPDGRVLVAGGARFSGYGGRIGLASAEIYTP